MNGTADSMAGRPFARLPRGSLYDMLQVTPRAEHEVIQASYRVLARIYHPDVSNDPNAAARMRELNAAYDVLGDRVRRAAYDAERAWAAHPRRQGGRGQPSTGNTRGRQFQAAPLPRDLTYLSSPFGFRGRLIFLIAALLAVVTLLMWLILEMLSDRPASLFLA